MLEWTYVTNVKHLIETQAETIIIFAKCCTLLSWKLHIFEITSHWVSLKHRQEIRAPTFKQNVKISKVLVILFCNKVLKFCTSIINSGYFFEIAPKMSTLYQFKVGSESWKSLSFLAYDFWALLSFCSWNGIGVAY